MDDLFYLDLEHRPFHFAGGPHRALLIHGFLGSPRELRPLAEALAGAGVTARGILLPGFGEQIRALPQVRASDWVAAASAAWEELQVGAARTTLIGFSMGGAVALRVAAQTAHPPDQLILLAPHWKFADRRAHLLPLAKYVMPRFRPFGRLDFDNPDVRRMFAELAPGADLDDPAVRHQFRDAATIPTRALDELRRIGRMAAVSAPRLVLPATIVQGLQDRTTLPIYSRQLAGRLRATLIELPGDHLIVDPSGPSWSTVREIVLSRATGTGN